MSYRLSFLVPVSRGEGRTTREDVVVCGPCLYRYQSDRSLKIKSVREVPGDLCESPVHEGDRGEAPEPAVEARPDRRSSSVDEVLNYPREEWLRAVRTADVQIVYLLALDLANELAARGVLHQNVLAMVHQQYGGNWNAHATRSKEVSV